MQPWLLLQNQQFPGERAAARSTGSALWSGGFQCLGSETDSYSMVTSFNLMITLSTKHPKRTLAKFGPNTFFFNLGKQVVVIIES